MLILNTVSVIIQFALITFVAIISTNIIKRFFGTMAPIVAPAIFVNHGGGPMPLLGDNSHSGLTVFLRDELKKHVNIKDFKAIILVTAHWEENNVTISSGEKHDLYFDYYGFPEESYEYKYPAPGSPYLAQRIKEALNMEGIPADLDPVRGWDHGVFVPMMLINPDADIPIVQMSVLSNQDPEQHYRIGQVLSQFRKEGVAIIGSGMSFHNMRRFFSARSNKSGVTVVVNESFDNFLNETLNLNEEERRKALKRWQEQPGAFDAHPPGAAEHFMPLIVVAGAGRNGKAERIFHWDYSKAFRLAGFLWRDL